MRFFFTLVLFFTLTLSCVHTAQAFTLTRGGNQLGLVAWYTFDGKDMTSNVADASGHGYKGNLVNQTPTTTMIGKVGQALKFDGVDDYVEIGDTAYSDSFSACAWVKSDVAANGNKNIFVKRNSGITNSDPEWDMIAIGSGDGNIYFQLASWDAGFVDSYVDSSATLVPYNSWYHVCGVQTGAGQNMYMYVNGTLRGTAVQGNPMVDSASSLQIGVRSNTNDTRYWSGAIDDARLYNRALSASEIKGIYSESAGSKQGISLTPKTSGLNAGLVGHWTFDGKDMTSNVADVSGNANNGHIIGQTSTSTTQGKLGQALLFDGNDDRVYVPDNNSLDITSAVTISAWVYPTAIGSCCQTIIDKEDLSGAERSNYVFQLDNRQLSFGFYNAGLANWATFYVSCCAESDLLSNNKWYHVVVTHTFGSGASTKIYVNGVVTTGTWTLGTGNESVVANSDPIYIGQSGNSGPYENFPGRIDDVRIYNRYLSSSEVAQLYAQGAGTKQSVSLTPKTSGLNSGLVGYWTFDGKDMTGNVKDTSGTGADGNLLNNTVASTTIGKFGQALNLDGVLGCVYLESALYRNNLNTTGTGTSTTWSAWIYPITHNTYGQIFSVAASYTQLVLLNGIPEIYMNGGFNLDSTNVISLNKWHHIVAVINGVTGESWIYVDGVQDAYRSFGSVYITQTGYGSFTIGCEDYNDEQFHGKIDDMRFYNRALSASEVKALYNMGR